MASKNHQSYLTTSSFSAYKNPTSAQNSTRTSPAKTMTPNPTSQPAIPAPTYQPVSPPPILYVRSYLTIHDLYIRFAPLKSLKHLISTSSRKPTKILPVLNIKDLFAKFGNTSHSAINITPNRPSASTMHQIQRPSQSISVAPSNITNPAPAPPAKSLKATKSTYGSSIGLPQGFPTSIYLMGLAEANIWRLK